MRSEYRKLRKDMDPKDTEVYPEPSTHHIIKCRNCSKNSRELLRYTLSCLDCRQKQHELISLSQWTAWANPA